jgi:ABC-2 type transport system permease protein
MRPVEVVAGLSGDARRAAEREIRRGSGWRHAWRVVRAEALKQHRTLFGSRLVYFSLFVWPALQLATAYYTFQPFAGTPGLAQRWSLAADPRAVFLFFTTGTLGYIFFWSLVQSAWHFSFERFAGTLELLFLSPANRLALILANGAAALAQGTWLFLCFAVGLLAVVGGLRMSSPLMFAVAFVGLLVPAVAWAALLNSVFIFTRDSGFLYTILEEPMSFFAGVRIPPLALPIWARIAGLLFPLATSLAILRGALLEGATLATLWQPLAFLGVVSALMLLAAAWLLRRGEEHARRSGSLTLF